MLRALCIAVLVCGATMIALAAPGLAQAHQDGCHAQHSCPSDTDSYVCGDTGNYSECPGLAAYALPALTTAGFASPDVGSTLNCSGGSWSANVVSRTYQWVRNGVDAEGQTTSTYVLTGADISVAVACRVTATDGRGQIASSTSNAVTLSPPPALIALRPPRIDASSLPVHTGSFLVCKPGTWSVATTATGFQWLRDGVAIPGATTDSYRVRVADVGSTLACQQGAKGARGQDGVAVTAGVVAKAVPALDFAQETRRGTALSCGASAARACRSAAGAVIRFGGVVIAPVSVAGKVVLQFQRKTPRGWATRKVSRVVIRDDQTFLALYKVPARAFGSWRVRALASASAAATASRASYRFFVAG